MASPHVLASEAGLAMLRRGGNAVDAATAAGATMAVVDPHMNGVGGDSMWLIYDASHGQLRGLNAAGRSAAGVDPDGYCARYGRTRPVRSLSRRRSSPSRTGTPGVTSWVTRK